MTGLLKLALGLRACEAAPNAQLRLLNLHVGDTLGGLAGARTARGAGGRCKGSGGSGSFGYSAIARCLHSEAARRPRFGV